VNQENIYDTGFLILKEDSAISSPISVLFYEFYTDLNTLTTELSLKKDKIQVIVSNEKFTEDTIGFGQSQEPELWDYADGVDTMDFLIKLS